MISNFVILGAGGDLASRYLFPALVQIQQAGRLPEGMTIVAVARSEMSTEEYRELIRRKLDEFADTTPEHHREAILESVRYQKADVTRPDELQEAFAKDKPSLVYLALPPSVFYGTIQALEDIGLPNGSRLVVEKPFGEDQESAKKLNARLHEVFPEDAVYRIDHFLGKQTVQNVVGLRFANRLFEPVWNCHHIKSVEIIWDETVALENRAGYYDGTGALKDMIQNHLLQLLCIVAMEPPTRISERELRNRKIDVLRAIPTLTRDQIRERTYRSRYIAGSVNGRNVPSYVDEENVDPEKNTETLAEVTFTIDNWRWAGVPFTLRSGKALGENRRHINIYMQETPHLPFDTSPPPGGNVLRLTIDPDHVYLDMNVNCPGEVLELRPVTLELDLPAPELEAYGNLICDVLEGDSTLFIRDDEAEEAWRIIDPILEAWAQGDVPLEAYEAGSIPEIGVTRGRKLSTV